MVLFDQLRISDNGKYLYINVHVNKADYFDNVFIDKLIIKTSEQVSEADPLSTQDACIYQYVVQDDTTKELNLVLKASSDFDTAYNTMSDKLLFVYVVCKGVPDPCTPCRLDEMTTLGVTFDYSVLYQKVMQMTKQLADSCNIPSAFIDLILLWNGFKAAVETEHYIDAIDYYDKMFRGNINEFKTSGCGCHG